jgi:hypothetical protein
MNIRSKSNKVCASPVTRTLKGKQKKKEDESSRDKSVHSSSVANNDTDDDDNDSVRVVAMLWVVLLVRTLFCHHSHLLFTL